VWDTHWSEQVAKHAVWLSGLVGFEQAEAILGSLGQIGMSDSSVWRRVEKWGVRCQAVETAQRVAASAALTRSEVVVAGDAPPPPAMGVAMDGAQVHIRSEGWKELKVGCVFEIALRPTLDERTGERLDLPHAVHTS